MELIGLTRGDHDALARMVAAWESGAFTRRQQGRRQLPPRVWETVEFINAEPETVPAWGVMYVTTPTTVDGEKVINARKPDSTYRWRYLVNSGETVAYGATGTATWNTDADKVLYDTAATPAINEEWGPKSGEWKLFQHRPGFLLDGRYNATDGVLWAMQRPPGQILVKNSTGSAIAAAGSGLATLFGGTSGSEATLGLTVTVRNRTSVSWANDKFGMADLVNGQGYVSPQQT